MAGTVVADTLRADSTSTLVLRNGVASTPPTVQDSAGTEIGTFCRAWVNFNGTTVTSPASMTGVNGSFNVSSVLDNGAGDYTVNFTTAMPDANYAVVSTPDIAGTGWPAWYMTQTASSCRIFIYQITGTLGARDSATVRIAVFR